MRHRPYAFLHADARFIHCGASRRRVRLPSEHGVVMPSPGTIGSKRAESAREVPEAVGTTGVRVAGKE